jgi:glyoxylase-like metal-dependent hydrolase (beta-lactamase superfamily II)
MQILAAQYAAEVFSKRKVIDFIERANYSMIDRLGLHSEYKNLNLEFDGIKVNRVAREGDIIDLGDGYEVNILEVPGHTQCSLAVHVPKIRALFPSDAAQAPIDSVNTVAYPSPQYDFALNKKSMERMASLNVDIVAFEHNGVVTDNDAKKILLDGVESFHRLENFIVDAYKKTGDFEKTIQKVSDELIAPNTLGFLQADVQVSLARAAVEKVLHASGF